MELFRLGRQIALCHAGWSVTFDWRDMVGIDQSTALLLPSTAFIHQCRLWQTGPDSFPTREQVYSDSKHFVSRLPTAGLQRECQLVSAGNRAHTHAHNHVVQFQGMSSARNSSLCRGDAAQPCSDSRYTAARRRSGQEGVSGAHKFANKLNKRQRDRSGTRRRCELKPGLKIE